MKLQWGRTCERAETQAMQDAKSALPLASMGPHV